MLSIEQSKWLESLQKRADRIIYPSYTSYSKTLGRLNIETLSERRLTMITKFIEKAKTHPTFSEKWFPKKHRNNYNTRHEEKYVQYKYNTERARKGPLNFFRTILNNE